jgi:hypothetical protein
MDKKGKQKLCKTSKTKEGSKRYGTEIIGARWR